MQLNIYSQTMLQSHQQKLRLSRFYLQPFHHFIAAKKPLQVIQHLSGINLGTKARLETRVWRLTKQKNVFTEQRHARALQAIKILIKITHTQCLPAAGSCRTRALADNERNLQHLFDSQGILIIFMGTFITLECFKQKNLAPFTFSLSPDRRYLLLAQNVVKLFRHSYLAQYTLFDIHTR